MTLGFGAAGSLVMAMIWVYYSAQIFLLGAEFTWAYALTFGSRKEQKLPGAAPALPSKTAEKQPDPTWSRQRRPRSTAPRKTRRRGRNRREASRAAQRPHYAGAERRERTRSGYSSVTARLSIAPAGETAANLARRLEERNLPGRWL